MPLSLFGSFSRKEIKRKEEKFSWETEIEEKLLPKSNFTQIHSLSLVLYKKSEHYAQSKMEHLLCKFNFMISTRRNLACIKINEECLKGITL